MCCCISFYVIACDQKYVLMYLSVNIDLIYWLKIILDMPHLLVVTNEEPPYVMHSCPHCTLDHQRNKYILIFSQIISFLYIYESMYICYFILNCPIGIITTLLIFLWIIFYKTNKINEKTRAGFFIYSSVNFSQICSNIFYKTNKIKLFA